MRIAHGIGALVAMGGVALAILWLVRVPTNDAHVLLLVDSYAEYRAHANEQASLIIVPGQGGNDRRQELFSLLTAILTEDVTDEERFSRARRAQELNNELRTQIDLAANKREEAERALSSFSELRPTLTLGSLAEEGDRLEAAMRAHQIAISDLIATLYAINGQTDDILSAVIAQQGALTDAHIGSINEATSMAESRFDRLRARYRDLESLNQSLDEATRMLVAGVL